jgi:hypothetical protein
VPSGPAGRSTSNVDTDHRARGIKKRKSGCWISAPGGMPHRFVTREFGIRVTAADWWPLLTARRRSTSTIQQDVRVEENHDSWSRCRPASHARSPSLPPTSTPSRAPSKGVQLNIENVDDVHALLPGHDVAVSEIQDYN